MTEFDWWMLAFAVLSLICITSQQMAIEQQMRAIDSLRNLSRMLEAENEKLKGTRK